jgi:hypothetical protein
MLKARSPFRALAKHRTISPSPSSRQGRAEAENLVLRHQLNVEIAEPPAGRGAHREDCASLGHIEESPANWRLFLYLRSTHARCRGSAPAMSAIDFLMMALPKELKFSAITTNAPSNHVADEIEFEMVIQGHQNGAGAGQYSAE